ncbi:MAG: alpha-L-fucosidase, partial [Promethearchaeota archaeon]
KIEGLYKIKDGKPIIVTYFGENPNPIEVEIEELFEGLENKGVRVKVEESTVGKAIYEDKDWNTLPFEKVHPEYKYCSDKGRERFLDMKFGMMVHWGFYSQLGIPESWPANRTRCDPEFLDVYYTLWQVFNPTEFNADEWAELAIKAGMQFFQLTSKHHDGFCMFDTKTKTWARMRVRDMGPGVGGVKNVFINYSILDTPYKAWCERHGRNPDIIGEVIRAFRERGLGVGLYFSHIDWNDPNFRWDKANRSFDPNYGPDTHPEEWKAFIDREKEQLRELFTNYGPVDQVFFDGTWFGLAKDEFVDIILMCRKLQPDCMFSDRGLGIYGDFTSPERWIPKAQDDNRLKDKKVWQVCDPIHSSWAYLPDDPGYKPYDVLLHNFVDAIAKGGTYVFAIAPDHRGKFPEKTIKTLEFMGDWLKKYGDAIYSTRPWKKYKEPEKEIYFTRSKDNRHIYAIIFGLQGKEEIEITGLKPKANSDIILLGTRDKIDWTVDEDKLKIKFSEAVINKVKDEIAFAISIEQE